MKQIEFNKPLRTVNGDFTNVKKIAHTSTNGEYTWICCLQGNGTNLIAYNMYGIHAGCNRGVDIENVPMPKPAVVLIDYETVKDGAIFKRKNGVIHFPAEINYKGVWMNVPPLQGYNFYSWQGLCEDGWQYRGITSAVASWRPCRKMLKMSAPSVTDDDPDLD